MKVGELILGTGIDNRGLKKELSEAESEAKKYANKLDKLVNKKIELEAKIKIDEKGYNNQVKQLQKDYNDAIEREKGFGGEVSAAKIAEIDNIYQERLNALNNKSSYYKNVTDLENIENQIKDNIDQQEIWNGKVDELQQKYNKKITLDNIEESTQNISSKMGGIIKKASKWLLAIFSVRSAYMLVRNAVSVISQYDEQFATDLEYIRYALAMSIKPLIEKIVNLAKDLLFYAGYIAEKWFGINLWENASVEGMKNTNKEAKKLEKTLAGFDEVNVLGSSSSTTNDKPLPTFDLSKDKVKLPKWMEWLGENRDLVLGIVGAIAGFKTIKSIIDVAHLAKVIGTAGTAATAGTGLAGIASLLSTISLTAAAIYLVPKAVKGVQEVERLARETTEAYDNVAENAQNNVKKTSQAIDQWKDAIDSGQKTAQDFTNIAIGPMMDMVRMTNESIEDNNKILKENHNVWDAMLGTYSDSRDAMEILHDKQRQQIRNLYDAMEVQGFTKESIAFLTEEIYKEKNALVETNGMIHESSLEYRKNRISIEKLDTTLELLDYQKQILDLKESNKNLNQNSEEYKKNIEMINNLQKSIDELKPNKEVRVWFNADTTQLEQQLGKVFGASLKTDIDTKWYNAKKTFGKRKMATGGIIDVPRTGVSLTKDVVGGEAGREGVLPLTNPNTMQELGREIGKWITLNLDLTNTIDGRILNRILEQLKGDSTFARNGGN